MLSAHSRIGLARLIRGGFALWPCLCSPEISWKYGTISIDDSTRFVRELAVQKIGQLLRAAPKCETGVGIAPTSTTLLWRHITILPPGQRSLRPFRRAFC